MWSGALDISHVLLSYSITVLTSPTTNILIATLKHTYLYLPAENALSSKDNSFWPQSDFLLEWGSRNPGMGAPSPSLLAGIAVAVEGGKGTGKETKCYTYVLILMISLNYVWLSLVMPWLSYFLSSGALKSLGLLLSYPTQYNITSIILIPTCTTT
jgi:hypothetical protein